VVDHQDPPVGQRLQQVLGQVDAHQRRGAAHPGHRVGEHVAAHAELVDEHRGHGGRRSKAGARGDDRVDLLGVAPGLLEQVVDDLVHDHLGLVERVAQGSPDVALVHPQDRVRQARGVAQSGSVQDGLLEEDVLLREEVLAAHGLDDEVAGSAEALRDAVALEVDEPDGPLLGGAEAEEGVGGPEHREGGGGGGDDLKMGRERGKGRERERGGEREKKGG